MPDPIHLLTAMAVAAIVAGVTLLLLALPWRKSAPSRLRLGWVWGVVLGTGLGCWLLDFRPFWPPREDQDRFLLLVLPAALLVESFVALVRRPRWLAWILRLALVSTTGRVLLHGSSYLADLAGPTSREWKTEQAALNLSIMAGVLALVWLALILLQSRCQSRSIPLAISLALAVAGIVVMITGYLSGGELGLPLSAALVGAVIASSLLSFWDERGSSIGIAVIGLFSILVLGRFFGALSTQQALILFLAPLLCWVCELPPIGRLPAWASGMARIVLVCAPLVFVAVQAQRESAKGPEQPPGDNEPSLQDYLNFGK
jgi:hypothetical protein